jgi:hypothetical protein
LPSTPAAVRDDVTDFIETHSLCNKELGWIGYAIARFRAHRAGRGGL